MRVNPQLTHDRLPIYAGRERRSKPRIYEPFWVTVQGIDSRDKEFEINTQLVNLSVLGLYMKLAHSIQPGTNLGAIIQFSTTPTNGVGTPRVAIEGVVLRVELKQRGAYGVALEFTHYRFL